MEDERTEDEIQEETKTQDSILDLLGFEPTKEEETEDVEVEEETETSDETETNEDEENEDSTDDDDDSETDSEDEREESNDEDADAEETETSSEKNAEPSSDEEPDKLKELEEANAKLLKLIEEGVANSLGVTQQPEQVKPTESSSKEPEPKPPANLAELIGDIDFNEMQDKPELFVTLMQKVVDHTRQSTIDGLQADLPTIINERATQAVGLQTMVDNFYRENSDLAAVKKTVSAVAQSIGAESPELEMSKVLVEAAKRTRKMLGLKDSSEKSSTDSRPKRRGKKPAIPKARGKHKKVQKKLSKEQKQINDLINDF